MTKRSIAFWGMVFILAAAWSPAWGMDCADPVQTESGLVSGALEAESGVCAWKGIPFAAAPVGDLRWTAPAPLPGWEGVRKAEAFGAHCMQSGVMALESVYAEGGMSEDCLYLNVWAPAKPGKYPVMVWIHGGGYYGGSSDTPMYWGDRLSAAGDVVVVSANYRLNIFGFLAHPGLREEDANNSTGSYASLDQVRALQWVHDNIEAMGGDPENVTIFGESAGGWSICTMVATPLARGLFQRAILESGGCEQSQDLAAGYAQSANVAEALGCEYEDLECLRATSAKKLLDKGVDGMMGMRYRPHHDGYLLTGTPLSMIGEGNYNQVPFMAGSNREEFGNAFKLQPKLKYVKPENYEQTIIDYFDVPPDEAARLAELYPLSLFDNRPVNAYIRMFGADMSLACPTYLGLLYAARRQESTWHYRFDFDEMRAGKYMGAAHAMEIPFIFGSLDRMPMNLFYDRWNMEKAEKLAKVIQSYWLNFAKTGDPNGEALPVWPEFDHQAPQTMVFDSEVGAENADLFNQRCEFWDEFDMPRRSALEEVNRK